MGSFFTNSLFWGRHFFEAKYPTACEKKNLFKSNCKNLLRPIHISKSDTFYACKKAIYSGPVWNSDSRLTVNGWTHKQRTHVGFLSGKHANQVISKRPSGQLELSIAFTSLNSGRNSINSKNVLAESRGGLLGYFLPAGAQKCGRETRAACSDR